MPRKRDSNRPRHNRPTFALVRSLAEEIDAIYAEFACASERSLVERLRARVELSTDERWRDLALLCYRDLRGEDAAAASVDVHWVTLVGQDGLRFRLFVPEPERSGWLNLVASCVGCGCDVNVRRRPGEGFPDRAIARRASQVCARCAGPTAPG